MRTDDYSVFCAAEVPGLARLAMALTGDRDEAHDLLSDSLVQALLHWDKVTAAADRLAYVRRIVTNEFLSHRRRWSSRHIAVTATGALPEITVADGSHRIDDRAELESLLRRFPRQQRAAIVLRYYLDLSDQGIAALLGCSTATVRSHLSHALSALRCDARHSTSLEER